MSRFSSQFQRLINQQITLYGQEVKTQLMKRIPPAEQIPVQNNQHWFKIPNIISVFVDMVGSTKLSARRHPNGTARAYQFFTGTAVDLFNAFDAPYIDVRGDGVFGLFDYDQIYRAFAAAVTFKTFAEVEFVPRFLKYAGIELGAHIGIDYGNVLVHRIGLKRRNGRTDRQNEVWAGKPVNMSAKLASMAQAGELLVSDRYFRRIKHERVRLSCSCQNNKKEDFWEAVDVTKKPQFDFDTAYCFTSRWCKMHGEEYCNAIMALDTSFKSHAR